MLGQHYAEFAALLQVIMIDLVLAGDNAIVIGMAAAGLSPKLRGKAIVLGIFAATVLRIVFALGAAWLMQLVGLVLLGGFLLLWVCWKMYRETTAGQQDASEHAASGAASNGHATGTKTLRQAVVQIVIADVSMSLDNVLAVAGAARDHMWALIFGLALSVVLMGAASAAIAELLNRFRWIASVGLLIILFVAVRMIYIGADDILSATL